MHNLGTVFRFEVIRTLKKKSFWITAFLFPVMMAAVFGIIIASNSASSDAFEEMRDEQYSVAVTDDSQLLDENLLAGIDAQVIENKQDGISQAQSGEIDAYFYYPSDVSSSSVEVYAQNDDIFSNSKYNSLAGMLLNRSVVGDVSASQAAVLQDSVQFSETIYQDGEEYNGWMEMIAPGIFLVLFYLLIAFFGNQMLTSTTEEKENRVIEMILTTVEARTLIVGKILSLVVLGFLQGMIVVVPTIIGYFLLREQLAIPDFDISAIPFDWSRIAISAAVFIVGFMQFTGLLVMIGAAVPTAKEAANFFGIIMILIFGPLYAASLFLSSPQSPIVIGLTLFPFTAPVPLMLRNAVGNLTLWEAGLAIGIMLITSVIILRIAVRIFRYGALEYSRKLSIKEILRPQK